MLNLSTASRIVLAAAQSGEQNNAFVVLLGIGTVFAGLIALIVICKLMGLFFAGTNNNANEQPVKAAPAAAPAVAEEIPNRQEMVAAISAVLAEELGTDVSAIRIHSIKRV